MILLAAVVLLFSSDEWILSVSFHGLERRINDWSNAGHGQDELRFRPAENRSIVSVSTLQELC